MPGARRSNQRRRLPFPRVPAPAPTTLDALVRRLPAPPSRGGGTGGPSSAPHRSTQRSRARGTRGGCPRRWRRRGNGVSLPPGCRHWSPTRASGSFAWGVYLFRCFHPDDGRVHPQPNCRVKGSRTDPRVGRASESPGPSRHPGRDGVQRLQKACDQACTQVQRRCTTKARNVEVSSAVPSARRRRHALSGSARRRSTLPSRRLTAAGSRPRRSR